jgi:hypothetical protein
MFKVVLSVRRSTDSDCPFGIFKLVGGVMVSVLSSSAVDREFAWREQVHFQ